MSRPVSSDHHQQMDLANASEEPWDWQEDILFESNSPFDIPHCFWDGQNQIQKDSWPMFTETTPIKDYIGFDYPVSSVDKVARGKGMEEPRSFTSQSKRRRMLEFPSSDTPTCITNENVSSAHVKAKIREDYLIEESDMYLSNAVCEEDFRSSESECMEQSPEEWMMECFNGHEVQMMPDVINIPDVPEEQLNVSEFFTIPPEMEMDTQQEITPRAPRICFTGTPSILKTSAKSTTPVVYPFTLIKPCGVRGAVTLNDINQRILTPVAPKSKHKKNKDTIPSYPTSAFSGKPVVALTKIHTEGGKGSITIMRTKG